MKNRAIRKHNIGNKGMSLVEVIIAVALLTIVIIPVMQSFVYSARFNAKARSLQKATVAAQTIMENYKAYPVEDICEQFVDSSFMIGSGTGVSYRETVHDLTSGQHTYMIDNISYENSTYDAQVVLTPRTLTIVNTYQDSDSYCDAVYMVEAGSAYDIYNTAINEVQTAWGALPDKADTVPDDFDQENIIFGRKVEINIESSGRTTVSEVYSYSASCEYATETGNNTFSYSGHVMMDADPSDGIDSPLVIYDNSLTEAASGGRAVLKNIYFYFYPLYTTSASDHWIDSDTVVVNSNYGALNFYAIKQKSQISATELEVRERAAYNSERIHFELNGQLVMYDNLNVNVGKVDSDPVAITNPVLSGGATRTASLHTDPQDKILVYDIAVQVYKSDAIEINPTTGNWSIKGGEQPILELTGTIND